MADDEASRVARFLSASLAACAGSLITSLATNPLSVAKTRLQLLHGETASAANSVRWTSMANCPTCSHYAVFRGGLSECLEPKPLGICGAAQAQQARHTVFSMLSHLVRTEGPLSLLQGLSPALWFTRMLPSVVLYMPVKDELEEFLEPRIGASSPAVAGTAARGLSIAVVSPIELISTQMRSGSWPEGVGLFDGLRRTMATSGIAGLYQGLGATLLRDLPFSGLYWAAQVPLRRRLSGAGCDPFAADVGSGFIAGGLAAIVTTPADVVKTRMQIAAHSPDQSAEFVACRCGALSTARSVLRTEGAAGFGAGMGARVLSVAPACAIMISTYEAFKRFDLSAACKRAGVS